MIWAHTKCLVSCPHMRAMGCLDGVFWRKLTVLQWASAHWEQPLVSRTPVSMTSVSNHYFDIPNGRDGVSNHQPHRWPVNSPHKWPVTRKMFPFDDVIMLFHAQNLHVVSFNGSTSNVSVFYSSQYFEVQLSKLNRRLKIIPRKTKAQSLFI